MRSLKIAIATATVALMLPAGSALAADDTVSGTTVDSLSVGVTTASSALESFAPGQTAANATPAALAVVATDSWSMTVRDKAYATSASPGKLRAATPGTLLCEGSADNLAQPLGFSAAAAPLSTLATAETGALPIAADGTTAAVATGTGSQTVQVTYSQQIGSTEQLRTGCAYSVTAEYTVG